jgi:hypothetical protein
MRPLVASLVRVATDFLRSQQREQREQRRTQRSRRDQATPRRSRDRHATPEPERPSGTSATREVHGDIHFEYSPEMDGDPDPGEVVWTWVPYEEDPSKGKDRPVIIVGRRGSLMVAVPLTSKRSDRDPQVEVGTGPWDRERRPSYAKVDRLIEVDIQAIRREGAILDRGHYDAVVAGVRRHHR